MELGMKTFTAYADTLDEAARRANAYANEWLAKRQWLRADGSSAYKLHTSIAVVPGENTSYVGVLFALTLLGPLDEHG